MNNILFTLALLVFSSSFSQTGYRLLECDCKENDFRQTFEINFETKQLKRFSSLNRDNGDYFEGESNYRNNVDFVGNSIEGFAIGTKRTPGRSDKGDEVTIYLFDFASLRYYQDTYYANGSTFKQSYTCFWLRKR